MGALLKINAMNLYFDTETTGLPGRLDPYNDYNEYPRLVQLSWICGTDEKDFIIRPDGWTIPDSAARIHGITHDRAMAEGVSADTALCEFILALTRADMLVAHNIRFDVDILTAQLLFTFGENPASGVLKELQKKTWGDSMTRSCDFVGACFADGRPGKLPTLTELHYKLFGEDFNAHNALEDVRALKRCWDELNRLHI